MTERDRLEAEQRTLAEDRASAAAKLAEQRSQILAVMAHEICTPLNGLIGFAELLCEADLPAEQKAQSNTVLQSGQVLLAVVNDVLDLAKLESGKVSLEMIIFSPAEVLRQSLTLCQALSAEKGLLMEIDLAPSVPAWARGDPTRLRQIVGNLLNNAVKFTDRGTITLRARTVSSEPDGRARLRVEVQDTGIGIPIDAQPRLFTMFEQADQGTSRRFGGTGLGLAICRRLVNAMGGEIGLESQPGAGSLFWFEVALGAATAPALAEAPPVALAGRALSVLVADDTATNRALLRVYLTSAGHRVTLVDDGVAAVSAAADRPYDLILMDVNMPNMDGLEAARRIRAGGPNARTVILAVSAGVSKDEQRSTLEAGMDGNLSKPLRRPDLIAAINAYFDAS